MAVFDKLRKAIDKDMDKIFDQLGSLVLDEVKKNASLTDHTLDQLAKLGHPYAIRGSGLHGEKVHTQSGDLLDAIELDTKGKTITVSVNEKKAPYAKYVVEGTKFMVPRNFITLSFNTIKSRITSTIFTALDRSVRRGGR
jgi:HK97 gp10 family phage protein